MAARILAQTERAMSTGGALAIGAQPKAQIDARREKKLRDAFERVDTKKTGVLRIEQMVTLVAVLNIKVDAPELREMMEFASSRDDSGYMSFEDFAAAISKHIVRSEDHSARPAIMQELDAQRAAKEASTSKKRKGPPLVKAKK